MSTRDIADADVAASGGFAQNDHVSALVTYRRAEPEADSNVLGPKRPSRHQSSPFQQLNSRRPGSISPEKVMQSFNTHLDLENLKQQMPWWETH